MAHEEGDLRVKIRKDIEAFLKSLGSTASEVKVFIVLSKKRKYLSVREIEELTELSSKSVRTALRRLIEKGLVKEKEDGGKKVYRSKGMKELMEIWKKRVEEALSHLIKHP